MPLVYKETSNYKIWNLGQLKPINKIIFGKNN
jgi:hypothetical protein